MNFTEATQAMSTGSRVRRPEWAPLRHIYRSKKSACLASGSIAEAGVVAANPTVPDTDPTRWGLRRWQPLLRDLLATDWEVVQPL